MKEIWKPIEWSEGRYLVSNLGRIKSTDWFCDYAGGTKRIKKGHLLHPSILKCGYAQIRLYFNGRRKHFYMHRLVAEAFIDNPKGLQYVNHKDENKANNIVSNLEWCTFAYNINYGTRNKRAGQKMSGANNPNYRLGKGTPRAVPICQYSLDGRFVKQYDCAATAMRETGINQCTIRAVANGKRKTAGGYLWKNLL